MSLPEIQNIPLRWATYFSQLRVSHEFANDLMFDSHMDYVRDQLVVSLKAKVLGEPVHDIQYPADWWQALRQRWFPEFWLNKYPVRMTRWSVAFLYPHIVARAGSKPVLTIYKNMRCFHE
jgi:hypothetical protein